MSIRKRRWKKHTKNYWLFCAFCIFQSAKFTLHNTVSSSLHIQTLQIRYTRIHVLIPSRLCFESASMANEMYFEYRFHDSGKKSCRENRKKYYYLICKVDRKWIERKNEQNVTLSNGPNRQDPGYRHIHKT